MLKEITTQIKNSTIESTLDGVEPISNNIVSARFGSLNGGSCLCPYYYNQDAQAKLVSNNLRNAKTANEFLDKINSMVETGKVKSGSEMMRLNHKTIDVLKFYLNNM